MFVEIGFWVCLGLVIYIYAGYPAAVYLLGRLLKRDVGKADFEPMIAVVISAFNEEREIEQTVVNKLSQDYPQNRLEVIVVSDGSTDRTDEIVRGLVDQSKGRLRLLRQDPRQGKTQALNLALRQTSAEIIVFADANSVYAPNALRSLVRVFADSSVGYATGRMIYVNPGSSGVGEGSGTYMTYENLLRELETRLGSIVGVDGGIDAIRRELYTPMRPDQLPDFVLPLSVVLRGKRVVYEPDAMLYEPALSDAEHEFRMRVRVSLRAFWALYDKRKLLNPLRYPLFAWQVTSHKLLRYGAFMPLAGLFVFNVWVVDERPIYFLLLLLQSAFYAAAALGHIFRRSPQVHPKLLSPYYFVVLNLACVTAFWKFLLGQKMVLWTPRGGA
jgi:cellulose synthase/poly-beta-1,6-N-acetylglucosamine synthase-like glycosyltransferase